MTDERNSMHLFAGGGGGLLADLILGHNPICAVEWDKYACSILRARAEEGWFPDLRVYEGDVRLFDPSEYKGRIHTLHAGFPCQDISQAGKQAGVGEGTRSGLYREALRILDVVRPRELYLENVAAILNNGLGTVLGDLAALGYDAQWICLRASDVGANHRRDRWWLLARRNNISSYTKHDRDGWREQQPESVKEKTAKLADTELRGCLYGQTEVKPTEARFDAQRELESSGSDVAYSASIGQQGQRKYVGQVNTTQDKDRQTDRVINSSKGNKGWWQSEPDVGGMVDELAVKLDYGWWGIEPEIGRVATGIENRAHRLKALGNGQVTLQAAVAYSILERLYEANH